nr:uncharacterized protein LOC127309931 [Lolium perenne]
MTNSTSAMSSRRERRPKPSPSPASASCRPASHRGQGVSPEHVAPSCIVLKVRPPPSLNPHLHHGRHTHPALGSTAGSPPRAAELPVTAAAAARGRRPGKPPHLPRTWAAPPAVPALPERPLRGTARRAARAARIGPGRPAPPAVTNSSATTSHGRRASPQTAAPADRRRARRPSLPGTARRRRRNSPRAPPPLHAELPLQTRELAPSAAGTSTLRSPCLHALTPSREPASPPPPLEASLSPRIRRISTKRHARAALHGWSEIVRF